MRNLLFFLFCFLLAPLFKKKQLRANKSSLWAGSKNILLQEAVNRGLIYLLPTPISHVYALHQVLCTETRQTSFFYWRPVKTVDAEDAAVCLFGNREEKSHIDFYWTMNEAVASDLGAI